MSTVFASQVDGWNSNDGFDGGWNDDQEFRYVPINSIRNDEGSLEGYSGKPSHYIDIDDIPELYIAQQKYERFEERNYRENIEIVKKCMSDGVILPSKSVIEQIIGKLKKIIKNG